MSADNPRAVATVADGTVIQVIGSDNTINVHPRDPDRVIEIHVQCQVADRYFKDFAQVAARIEHFHTVKRGRFEHANIVGNTLVTFRPPRRQLGITAAKALGLTGFQVLVDYNDVMDDQDVKDTNQCRANLMSPPAPDNTASNLEVIDDVEGQNANPTIDTPVRGAGASTSSVLVNNAHQQVSVSFDITITLRPTTPDRQASVGAQPVIEMPSTLSRGRQSRLGRGTQSPSRRAFEQAIQDLTTPRATGSAAATPADASAVDATEPPFYGVMGMQSNIEASNWQCLGPALNSAHRTTPSVAVFVPISLAVKFPDHIEVNVVGIISKIDLMKVTAGRLYWPFQLMGSPEHKYLCRIFPGNGSTAKVGDPFPGIKVGDVVMVLKGSIYGKAIAVKSNSWLFVAKHSDSGYDLVAYVHGIDERV